MTRVLLPLLLLVIPVQAAASPVVVAILDSGVDASHPALVGRIVPGYDVWYGDADPDDRCGHGTNLAGIVAQLAPDAAIMPIKVMADECYGTYSRMEAGIVLAIEAGAHIVLIASGGYLPNDSLAEAVAYAQGRGALVVGGAGNDGTDAPFYPAAYALTVSAVDRLGGLYYRSNYGPHIDLAALGVEVRTAGLGGDAIVSGTSFAGAHAAGVAALTWAAHPAMSADDVAALLMETARDCAEPGRDDRCGWGQVDAVRAVAPVQVWLPMEAS